MTEYYKPQRKRAKVLRIHESDEGYKFQVMGGLRFGRFCQGTGFHVDIIGWRITMSIRRCPWRDYIKHWRYYFRIRWDGYNPPWDYMEIRCAFLRVTFAPAYGGYLA